MAMEEVRSYKFSPRTNIDLKTLNFDRMIGNSSVSFKSFGLQCARKSDNSSNLLISSQNESKCKFVPRYHPDDDGKNFTVTKEEPEMFRVKTRNGTNSKGKPLEHSGSDLLFHRRITGGGLYSAEKVARRTDGRNETEQNENTDEECCTTALSDYAASYLHSKGKTDNFGKLFSSKNFDKKHSIKESSDVERFENDSDKQHPLLSECEISDSTDNNKLSWKKPYTFLKPPTTIFRTNRKSMNSSDINDEPLNHLIKPLPYEIVVSDKNDGDHQNIPSHIVVDSDDLNNEKEIVNGDVAPSDKENRIECQMSNLSIDNRLNEKKAMLSNLIVNNSDSGLGSDDDSVKSISSPGSGISDLDEVCDFKCEDNNRNEVNNDAGTQLCSLDCSDISADKSPLEADYDSHLSIVLCRRWGRRRSMPIKIKSPYHTSSSIKCFQFDTPSPDDLIKISR